MNVMGIRSETQQPPAAERTRFERIQLPDGQLSVVRPLPPDFPPDFVRRLIDEKAWEKEGKILEGGTREPELIYIGAVPVVRKRSRSAGRYVRNFPKRIVAPFTPSAQMALVDKARNRYRETYGKDLTVEEPFAFYIDKETSDKHTFFRYYEEIDPKELGSRYREMREKAEVRVLEINKKLKDIGVDRHEAGNYLIVKDPSDKDGTGIVLIDTEFWTIND